MFLFIFFGRTHAAAACAGFELGVGGGWRECIKSGFIYKGQSIIFPEYGHGMAHYQNSERKAYMPRVEQYYYLVEI